MIEAYLAPFSLAAISALTFLAYKHPSAYSQIHSYIHYSLIFVVCSLLIWNFAVIETSREISLVVSPDGDFAMRSAVNETREHLMIPFKYIIGIYLPVSLYLSFLLVIPHLINSAHKDTTDNSDHEDNTDK
ncbi:MAG: hypothetical protein AB2563_03875 [Candidatus Thiodiazotropha endolucinida]